MKWTLKSNARTRVAASAVTVLLTLPLAMSIGGRARTRAVTKPAAASGFYNPARWKPFYRLRLGSEKPGFSLDAVVDGSYPSLAMLRAAYRGRRWIVADLNDFRGMVQINDPDAALRYVRLWAAPGGDDLSIRSVGPEIVDLKTFRCTLDWEGRRGEVYPRFHSGLEGVLSERAFHAGGFSLPRIEKTPTGSVIERWVYRIVRTQCVQRVREFVGRDGSYRRVIVQQLPLPALPGTTWMGMGRR